MAKPKASCDDCGRTFNTKALKKINGNVYCHVCAKYQSKCLMPNFKGKVPAHLKPKEKTMRPKIKGAKEKRVAVSRNTHLFIKKDEKAMLYKKLIKIGKSPEEASERVNRICEKMRELTDILKHERKENKITEEQMNQKFLEGLEKYSQEELSQ